MSKQILLVEDSENLQKVIKMKLVSAGFVVTEVNNGNTALSVLEQQGFDLIITDIVMPHKNGLEFLQVLRQKNNQTPVVVLSNVSRKEELDELKNLGVNTYLVKMETSLESMVKEARQLLE